MLKILVDAKNLQYLNRFASKEPTRYWMQGVYFAPNFDLVASDQYGQSVVLNEIDASYPEYAKVIPESTSATDSNKVAFNPSYMADFAGYEKGDRLQIEIHDETAPILVKNSALDDFTGVLMPYRW